MPAIARMRFQSARKPEEDGFIVLDGDGTLHIEPSEAMLEAVAALEQQAVETSSRVSKIAAFTLIGLGLAAAAAGWYAGRTGGKLREQLTYPRDVNDITAQFDIHRGLQLDFRSGKMPVSLNWLPGEYNADEAEHFYNTYLALREETTRASPP